MGPPAGSKGTKQSGGPMGRGPEPLRLKLLGGFSVSVGSRTIQLNEWRLRKAAALVKLLALSPNHRLHREQVMDALWPELGKRAASNNLRGVLLAARRALASDPAVGSHYLATQDEQLALPSGRLWVDVEAFEEAAATARRSRDPAAYRAAIELYAGEFLPIDIYEEWTEVRRQELHGTFLTLLVELAGLYEERDEHGAATESLQRVLVMEPTLEEAHAGLMRLYALSGRRREALRQYERLEEVLSTELGAEPEATTQHLRKEIEIGQFPPPRRPPSPDAPPAETSGSGMHNLPAARTSFVGREREMVEVKRELDMTPLLTLMGAGGSGKPRLALEVARSLIGAYPEGKFTVTGLLRDIIHT